MPAIATRQSAPTPLAEAVPLPPKVPQLPDEVFERFPSLRDWQEDQNKWWTRAYTALQDVNRNASTGLMTNNEDTRTLRVSFGEFKAEITEEIDAIADEQGAQARRIVTVSAMAGVPSNIKVQTTAPVSPSINDYWIDNSDVANPITYQWTGTDWDEVTDPIAFAGVADERTARVTADGYLEGKYTLTVVAGTVITGFNITSASGPGTNVSNVAWTADQFQIYSGSANKVMFYADGVQDKVRLSNVLTIDGAGNAIYIKTTAGAGSYNNAGTPWYVDSNGRMSLGTGLTFDGTNLSIVGNVTAGSGTIGGWTINSSTLSKNNAILDSAGQLVLGTSNDVVYLSATDATFRLWVGNVTAGSATFAVSKTGALFSTSGTIGGFTISTNSLSAGTGANYVSFSNGIGTTRLQLGDTAATNVLLQRGSGGSGGIYIFLSGQIASHASLQIDSSGNGSVSLTDASGVEQLRLDASGAPTLTIGDSGVQHLLLRRSIGGTPALLLYNSSNVLVSDLEADVTSGAGYLRNSSSTGTNYVEVDGGKNFGQPTISWNGDTTLFRSSSGTLKTGGNFVATGGIAVGGGSSNPLIASSGRLYLAAGGANRWYISDSSGNFVLPSGQSCKILKESSDGWTVTLNDGTADLQFQASGGQIYGRINGGSPILLG